MPIPVSNVAGTLLHDTITPERVAGKLGRALPSIGTPGRASIDDAIVDAIGVVLGFLRRDDIDTMRTSAIAAIEAVTVRVAARFWDNPQEVGSTSYNEVSINYRDPRVLTGDEQTALKPYRLRRRTPIILSPYPAEETTA